MARKVLIIDDDKDLSGDIARVLSGNGYEVYKSYSATDGLKTALKIKPDILILDVMMETDTAGFETAYKIRSDRPQSKYKDIRDIPIIMLTAINQVTNSRFSLNDEESFLPGVNDFLTKPVNFDELLEKMNRYT